MGRRDRPVRYPEPAAMCGHGPQFPHMQDCKSGLVSHDSTK